MNREEFLDKLMNYTQVAVASGRASPSEVLSFVRELARHWQDGDNLRLVEAAARAGCKTGLSALKWAREMGRAINADADREMERLEKERAQAETAKKPKAKAAADNPV